MSEFEIPSKCIGCGLQDECLVEVEEISKEKNLTKSLGAAMLRKSAKRLKKAIDNGHPTDRISPDIQANIDEQTIGQDLAIDRLSNVARAYSDACDGVLSLDINNRGVHYKIGVCTSALLYRDGETVIFPGTVRIEPTD